ncbi:MAG TPA: N-acetylglucosamine-6-phosphate deacetylase [Chthoniobacterales bacterium]|jgi:N-acetylglucosamine-6-phosphate deacetylase|nr:N-acetylglucosamine-6-phosphate deacetylase [Chthoniobacterales bacterium]
MIFVNARLILPDGIRDGLELVVEDGKIAEIREQSSLAESIDLRGNYLAPGFIDLHIHGALGRDTMEAKAEAFRAICDYHATGGTTSLLITTVTAPVSDIVDVLKTVRGARSDLPQIAGVHIEGPFISKTRAGAQRAEFIRDPETHLIDQLMPFADIIKIMTVAPELPGALALIDRLRLHKIIVSGGHSDATDVEARAAAEYGMRHVTHTFNAMSSARRQGIYRDAGLLEFALSEPDITCELIADGHHVAPTLMKMLYRAKGPRGICLVTDATAGAGLPTGTEFTLSGRRCVVGDGVCLLSDRSALAGSASRMIDLVRVMVNQVGVPLNEAVAMATANPARALGLNAKGKLKPGADADLVILSRDLEVRRTLIAGERVFKNEKL